VLNTVVGDGVGKHGLSPIARLFTFFLVQRPALEEEKFLSYSIVQFSSIKVAYDM
jgi:hypothetical protein